MEALAGVAEILYQFYGNVGEPVAQA